MFKIKTGKIIAVSVCAAVMLTGCGNNETGGTPVYTSSSARSTAQSASSAQSSASEQSAVSEQGRTESEPQPSEEALTVVYNHDPQNECTITFDGQSIIVRGKRNEVMDDVADIMPDMNIKSSANGGETTYVLTPEYGDMDWDYGSFVIYDKSGHGCTVNIKSENGKITLPDVTEVMLGNRSAAENAAALSPGQTAQYITMDGTLDNAAEIWGEIEEISNGICEGLDDDYDKLRAISRWVSDNIYYDHPIYSEGAPKYCLSLEYMLNNRSSICGGYSNMTSALCAVQGIRCLNVSGMAINYGMCFQQDTEGDFHEWNVAEIDGRRVIVDSGWNSGNDFNYDGTFDTGSPRYRYFDVGEEIFALDHKAQKAEYRDYLAAIR